MRLRLIGKWDAKRYGEKIQVEERKELSEATDEELEAALKKRLRELQDDEIDIKALLDSTDEAA